MSTPAIALALTERQVRIVDQACCNIAPELHVDFIKHIEDLLRPKRQLWDSDIAWATCAALTKYRPRPGAS